MAHGATGVRRIACCLSLTLLVACGSSDYLHKLVGPRRLSFGRLDLPCNDDGDCTAPARCRPWQTPAGQRSHACFIACQPDQAGRGNCPWPLACGLSVVAGTQVGPTCEAPAPDEWRCWRPDGSVFACELRDPPLPPRVPPPKGHELGLALGLLLALGLFPLAACVWLARRLERSLPAATPSGIRTASTVLTFLCWAAVFVGAELTLAALLFGMRPWLLPVVGFGAALLFGWLRQLIRPPAVSPPP
jgi:hypothetical protein